MAENASKAGHKVNFFSFARPYFIALKHEERLNRHVLRSLSKGVKYDIDSDGHYITNFTWPTLRIPEPFHHYMPSCFNRWLEVHSLTPFKQIQERYLEGTDVFVIESCDGMILFDLIKKHNPEAKVVYRPSDPIMVDGCRKEAQHIEEDLMRRVDMNYIVNDAGFNLYRRKISDFDKTVKSMHLPNGVDTSMFRQTYPTPGPLKQSKTFLYVGARIPEWELIIKAARERPAYNFVIVCPEKAPEELVKETNITYVAGIPAKDVAAWVTNCDVVIVPNPKGAYKIKPWGITAKYYQAMAAMKPIVAFDDTEQLSYYGVHVAYNYDEFISHLDVALAEGETIYDFKGTEWNDISNRFLNSLNDLCLI